VQQRRLCSILSVIRFGSAALAILFAAAQLLQGCKADGGKEDVTLSSRVSLQSSARTAVDRRPLIVCFGDSLTAGYGTDPGQAYPDYLQKLLDADGHPYRVVNAGVSGNTTKDGRDRVAHILTLHPEVVVLEFGGNDGLRGLPIESTRDNMAAMIAELQQAGIKVALAGITLPPDYGPDYIRSFNAMYPTLAKTYKVPYLPFLLKDVYGVPGDMQEDHTHATAQGNQRVAANVEALIMPILKN
jgi:acyl-CoA thioesterase-1